jgi:hypothetical protein
MGFKVHYHNQVGKPVTEHFATATDACGRVSVLLSPPMHPNVLIVSDEGADYSLDELITLSQREQGDA